MEFCVNDSDFDFLYNVAIVSKKHSGLVLTMIERAVTSLEKSKSYSKFVFIVIVAVVSMCYIILLSPLVRRQQFTGFAVRNIDSKLKYFIKMKRQLQSSQNEDYIQGCPSFEMTAFPSDCYRQIVAYLTHPRDVLNFGLTNS